MGEVDETDADEATEPDLFDDAQTETVTTKPIAYGLKVSVIAGASRGAAAFIGARGIRVGSAPDNGLVLDDRRVSRYHAELTPHPAGVRVCDLDSRNGILFGGHRITDAVLAPGALISVGDSELIIEPADEGAPIEPASTTRLGGLFGRSLAMRRLYTILERVAPTDYTVLIEGETGTGKEVVAQTLHQLSPRKDGPFVVFDCAATAESLLESELFGHVRGAFTGAVASRDGAFRRAQAGTLFIDEVNSLPLALQGKLLRALETKRIHAVGADREIEVDLRIVVASNRALEAEVKAGRFRDDLYFRLSVVRAVLPALRDRREDIPLLVKHFIAGAGVEGPVEGPNLDRLVGYDWPGNVRELRHVLERAIVLAGTRGAHFKDLPIVFSSEGPTLSWPMLLDTQFREAKEHLLSAFERLYVTHLLERTGGKITEAVRRSGLSRRQFFELRKKHGLTLSTDEGEEPSE